MYKTGPNIQEGIACKSLMRPDRRLLPQYGSIAVGTLSPVSSHFRPSLSPAPAAMQEGCLHLCLSIFTSEQHSPLNGANNISTCLHSTPVSPLADVEVQLYQVTLLPW